MSWDDRILPLLSDQWQSSEALAKKLNEEQFTVLARLKDMMRRNLAERRIVGVKTRNGKTTVKSAEFRRLQLTP